MLDAVVGGGRASCWPARTGEVVACGLDHQGESVLAWDAESGEPLTPIVTWQDKRSQEVLDRLEADGARRRGQRAQRHAAGPLLLGRQARPGCSSTTTRSAARATRARCGWARSTRSSATGSAPAFATDPSTASRTQLGAPEWDPRLLEIFGVPARAPCRRSPTRAGDLGTLRHPSWPVELPLRARCVDQQAALAGAGLRRARAWSRRPTAPACSCSPTPATSARSPSGGLLPTVAWRVDGPGRVGARRRRVHGRGAARVAEPRPRAWPATRRRSPRPPRPRSRTRAASGCCRRSPGWARRGGGRDARAVIAGLTAGARPGHIARAALEAIAWRVADVVAAVRESVAGRRAARRRRAHPRADCCLQLQADAAGVPVQRGRGRRDRRRGGRAGGRRRRRLGRRRARSPSGSPRASGSSRDRDDAWREREHAAWREFVERAAEL